MASFHKFFLIKLFVILFVHNSHQISQPDDQTYFAGVIEYAPETSLTPKQNLDKNVNVFENIIGSAYTRKADILVFPAHSLNTIETATFVPLPNDTVPPCVRAANDNFLSKIACAAQNSKKYVMINVFEKENCDINARALCNSNGINYFNTNIVFNRNGTVIAQYRERFLMPNHNLTLNVKPDIVSFQTDFGVKMGILTNYELLLWSPAQELINSSINDILYTGQINSQLPFLTATQLLDSWSYANGVNLIAAGIIGPNMTLAVNTTLASTGIYGGKSGLLNLKSYQGIENSVIHVTQVPKKGTMKVPINGDGPFVPNQTPSRRKDVVLSRDTYIANYTTLLLDINATDITESLCHKQLCCNFTIQRNPITTLAPGNYSSYRYRLAAFSGNGQFSNNLDNEIEVCALFACLNSELSSCGQVFANDISVENRFYFKYITISGNFSKLDRILVMPSTLDGMLKSLPAGNIDMEVGLNGIHTLELMQNKNDLLTFGMYANLFHNITFEDFIPITTTTPPVITSITPTAVSTASSSSATKPEKSSSSVSLPMSIVSFVILVIYSTAMH